MPESTLPLPPLRERVSRRVMRCLRASRISYPTCPKTSPPIGAVLVLNSTNLWRGALPYVNDPHFAEVSLYWDNDDAGSAVSRKLF
jgi:hypothetical protein